MNSSHVFSSVRLTIGLSIASLLLLGGACSADVEPLSGRVLDDASVNPDSGDESAPPPDEPLEFTLEAQRSDVVTFSDVSRHAARIEIEGLARAGAIAGFADGTFRPDAQVTRAQFAAVLSSAFVDADAPLPARTYSDVPRAHWAASAISRASAAGFLRGDPSGSFRPDAPVSRVEVVAALVSGLDYPAGDWTASAARYSDAAAVPTWARDAVAAADAGGFYTNHKLRVGERLRPTVGASRADVASYVYFAGSLFMPSCSETRCPVEPGRGKFLPIAIGGVVITAQQVILLYAAAVTLGYIGYSTSRPTFRQAVGQLSRLSSRQLWTALNATTEWSCFTTCVGSSCARNGIRVVGSGSSRGEAQRDAEDVCYDHAGCSPSRTTCSN